MNLLRRSLVRPLASFKRRGIEEFGAKIKNPKVGRSWRASELRHKSNEDLEKLWFVCLKEKNRLLTERYVHRSRNESMPNPDRMLKTRKTMARIKTVLREREIKEERRAFIEERTKEKAERRAHLAQTAAGVQDGAHTASSKIDQEL